MALIKESRKKACVKDIIEHETPIQKWCELLDRDQMTIKRWISRYREVLGYPDFMRRKKTMHDSDAEEIARQHYEDGVPALKIVKSSGYGAGRVYDVIRDYAAYYGHTPKSKKDFKTKHTQDDKMRCVLDVIENGVSIAQAAHDMGVSRTLISDWKKRYCERLGYPDHAPKPRMATDDLPENEKIQVARSVILKEHSGTEFARCLGCSETTISRWKYRFKDRIDEVESYDLDALKAKQETKKAPRIDKGKGGHIAVGSVTSIDGAAKMEHVIATYGMTHNDLEKYARKYGVTGAIIKEWHKEAIRGLDHELPTRLPDPHGAIAKATDQIARESED